MRRSTRSSCAPWIGIRPVPGILVLWMLLLVSAGCEGGESPSGTADSAAPAGVKSTAGGAGSSALERPMPEFAGATLDGDTLRTVDLRGKVTLVNFWATWCGPCVVEMPELIGLHAEWRDRPFEIVGVSMDEEGFDIVRPFAEDFGVTYPVILDKGPLADAFGGVYGLPTTFIVDARGTVIHRYVGLFPFDEVREDLDRMINELES